MLRHLLRTSENAVAYALIPGAMACDSVTMLLTTMSETLLTCLLIGLRWWELWMCGGGSSRQPGPQPEGPVD